MLHLPITFQPHWAWTLIVKALSLGEAKEILDVYDSPRDTGPQLEKFLAILAVHRKQMQVQLDDIQANLEELRMHEKEALTLLKKVDKAK